MSPSQRWNGLLNFNSVDMSSFQCCVYAKRLDPFFLGRVGPVFVTLTPDWSASRNNHLLARNQTWIHSLTRVLGDVGTCKWLTCPSGVVRVAVPNEPPSCCGSIGFAPLVQLNGIDPIGFITPQPPPFPVFFKSPLLQFFNPQSFRLFGPGFVALSRVVPPLSSCWVTTRTLHNLYSTRF